MIFDPADPRAVWPMIPAAERSFIAAVASGGARAMVSNVRTRWLALSSQDRVLPMTVNDGAVGDSYVCLPHSAYILYGLREIELVGVHGATVLSPVMRLAGRMLLAAGINRIVHIDNWLLSTNLHGGWTGADLPAIRAALTGRFPGHILAIRSVDDWSSPTLAAAARDDGWIMVPSRQIWVSDDLDRAWRPRNGYANDRRLVARSGLTLGPAATGDIDRITDLYRQLYIGKYSALNPVFTTRFIAETMASGLIDYRVARARDGSAVAVSGLLARGDVATPPVVGYDMSAPRSAGLYRVASWLFGQSAMERGLRLHGSAGAGEFKRLRGAHAVIEYWAMYVAHLPAHRRLAIRALALLLERHAVPMMKRRGL